MKILKKIFLFILLFVIVIYLILFTSFHFLSRDNFINKNTRIFFLKSQVFKTLLLLDEYGDARFEYISPAKSKVFVELDYQTGYPPQVDVKTTLEDVFYDILGKSVEIKIVKDKEVPDLPEFEDKHIKEVLSNSQNYQKTEDQDYLHILYLSRSSETPDIGGLVLGDKDIIIFKEAIDELSSQPDIIRRIEESTIKHELGHQLGVEHIERKNCIMSEYVESLGDYKYQKNNIPLDYCGETLVTIDDYKNML